MESDAFNGFLEGQENSGATSIARQDEQQALQKREPQSRAISSRETLDFQLVQQSNSQIVELATPLIGLCVRTRSMESYENVPELHARTAAEIETFTREIETAGYDSATILAARYCICAMIDESVMGQHWGAESMWPESPMLSIFHNETWGGEKFFAILDRVINEADRFPDLLEFMQILLLLGFEGKYHVAHNGALKLQHLQNTIDEILREDHKQNGNRLLFPEAHVYDKGQKMRSQITVRTIVLSGLGVLLVAYVLFSVFLSSNINKIGEEIDATLASQGSVVSEQGG